jgi:5'-nucleotidase
VLPGEDGMGNLKQRVREAAYPWLSSNIVVDQALPCSPGAHCNALGQRTVFQPRVILHRRGKNFCIIGGTTDSTPNITHREFVEGTRFEPLTRIVPAEAKWLRQKQRCDCMLLLVHEGMRYEADGKRFKEKGLYSLVRNLPPGTIDAVIGGHSHIRIQEVINELPILQAGWQARVVGTLDVTFEGNSPRFKFGPFMPVPTRQAVPDITKVLQPYRKAALKLKNEVVGATTAEFERSTSAETALGNLVADAVWEAAKKQGRAQFCLMNAGGIRSDLKQGTITFEDVFKVMPFDNELAVAKLTGKELLLLLQVAFSGAEGIPAVSGLRVKLLDVPMGQAGRWDRDLNKDGKKEEWERNVLVEVVSSEGKPLQLDKYYLLATNSYLVHSGDYQNIVYDQVPKERMKLYDGVLIRDILVAYFRRNSPLNPLTYLPPQQPRVQTVRP